MNNNIKYASGNTWIILSNNWLNNNIHSSQEFQKPYLDGVTVLVLTYLIPSVNRFNIFALKKLAHFAT